MAKDGFKVMDSDMHISRACRRIPLEVLWIAHPSCPLCIRLLFGLRSSLLFRSLTR
jgi:hypothetical protein